MGRLSLVSPTGRRYRRPQYPAKDYFNLVSEDRGYSHSSPPASSAYSPRTKPPFQLGASSPEAFCSKSSYNVDEIDVEAACDAWTHVPDERVPPWLRWRPFGSKLQQKARNPSARGVISYSIRNGFIWKGFLLRWAFFLVYCVFISSYHDKLGLRCGVRGNLGVDDTTVDENPVEVGEAELGGSLLLMWAETLLGTGACFLLAQGYFGMRATRERMERVRQTSVTLAYSFLKTTNTEREMGIPSQELQLILYECLTLLTAFPVALVQQILGNTCEPALPRYCHETARALKRLRAGQTVSPGGDWHQDTVLSDGQRYVHVDYFMEIFSLQLQMEYQKQAMRTAMPSMAVQHIIFSIRNHFENMTDAGNLDDRRVPIMRENIDMLALAGRECSIFCYTDAVPQVFLWTIDIASRLLAFSIPGQNCGFFAATNHAAASSSSASLPLKAYHCLAMVLFALISASLVAILDEMWRMWDPFGRGLNLEAWTLGIAREIDNVLNDFYEGDDDDDGGGDGVLSRRHSYMEQPCSARGSRTSGSGSCDDRALTV